VERKYRSHFEGQDEIVKEGTVFALEQLDEVLDSSF
jgi:hypothetical protein